MIRAKLFVKKISIFKQTCVKGQEQYGNPMPFLFPWLYYINHHENTQILLTLQRTHFNFGKVNYLTCKYQIAQVFKRVHTALDNPNAQFPLQEALHSSRSQQSMCKTMPNSL